MKIKPLNGLEFDTDSLNDIDATAIEEAKKFGATMQKYGISYMCVVQLPQKQGTMVDTNFVSQKAWFDIVTGIDGRLSGCSNGLIRVTFHKKQDDI